MPNVESACQESTYISRVTQEATASAMLLGPTTPIMMFFSSAQGHLAFLQEKVIHLCGCKATPLLPIIKT